MTDPLTPAELARLAAAGIEYPWHPRQMLGLLDKIDRLRSELATARRRGAGVNQPCGTRRKP